jgi:hypothetical protein
MRNARVMTAVAFAMGALGPPARAQTPDVLSEAECPGCAKALGLDSRIAGTWSSALTSSEDPEWRLEDFFCFIACTPEARAGATLLLEDPANAASPTLDLYARVVNANASQAAGHMTPTARAKVPQNLDPTRSPMFACDPHGFASQVVSPLPLEIVQYPGAFVLHYEEFNVVRTIPIGGGGRRHPPHPHPFGVSGGRLEHGALVVETSGIPAGRFYDWFGGGPHGDQLRATERYSTSDDGHWLLLELTFDDPETLREPLVLTKRWRRTPDVEIRSYGCDVMSGQLENVFAFYVDPRELDRRRGSEQSSRRR